MTTELQHSPYKDRAGGLGHCWSPDSNRFGVFFFLSFFSFLFFFSFFLPHPQHMEIPRPGTESEPQRPLTTRLWQCWILNLLRHSRNPMTVIVKSVMTQNVMRLGPYREKILLKKNQFYWDIIYHKMHLLDALRLRIHSHSTLFYCGKNI